MASHDGLRKPPRAVSSGRTTKCVVLVCINLSNLVCHSVYSVLASFFPQEARAKGLSDEPIGLVFAIFAAVIFVAAPFVSHALTRYGKRQVYVAGLAIVALGTVCFAMAASIESLPGYFLWCLCLRCVQGFGSALEETAAYALIADVDPDAVSFNLGITEISTGLGYMVGPTVGGILFALGGFAAPFICIAAALVPALLLIIWTVPDDSAAARAASLARDQQVAGGLQESAMMPLQNLLVRPQILAIALTAVLGNSDYAFLEPTLAGHVEAIAASSTSVGMLFSVTSLTYTVCSPVMGWLSHKHRLGPRTVILLGTAFQSAGFLLIGPSPLVSWMWEGGGDGAAAGDGGVGGGGGGAGFAGAGVAGAGPGEGPPVSLGLVCTALLLFGIGEAMSMTPLMEDMMLSCVDHKHDAINSLSALMTSCFSLGQMVGPLAGSFLSARVGFHWSSTAVGLLLAGQTAALAYLQRQSRPHQAGGLGWLWSGTAAHAQQERGDSTELSALTTGDGSRSPVDALDAPDDSDGGQGPGDKLEAKRKWSS